VISRNCALNADGTLKDASEIDWLHDPDDDTRTVVEQRHSGRTTKPSAKVREANSATSIPAKPAPKSKRGVSLLSDDDSVMGEPQKSMYLFPVSHLLSFK